MKLVALSTDLKDDHVSLRHTYPDFVMRCGAVPILLPVTTDEQALAAILDRTDALLLTGGVDIAPALYGEQPIPELGTVHPERDAFELLAVRLACKRQMPIYGICRGLQLLNVFFGGTLFQDIDVQHEKKMLLHSQTEPRHVLTHAVTLNSKSRLAKIYGQTSLNVNSFHHQAVKCLGDGFESVAFSPDGICEAIEHKTLPIIAVQWHPEDLNDVQLTF